MDKYRYLFDLNFVILVFILYFAKLTTFFYDLPNPNQNTNLSLLTSTLNLIAILFVANLSFFLTNLTDYVYTRIFKNRRG